MLRLITGNTSISNRANSSSSDSEQEEVLGNHVNQLYHSDDDDDDVVSSFFYIFMPTLTIHRNLVVHILGHPLSVEVESVL